MANKKNNSQNNDPFSDDFDSSLNAVFSDSISSGVKFDTETGLPIRDWHNDKPKTNQQPQAGGSLFDEPNMQRQQQHNQFQPNNQQAPNQFQPNNNQQRPAGSLFDEGQDMRGGFNNQNNSNPPNQNPAPPPTNFAGGTSINGNYTPPPNNPNSSPNNNPNNNFNNNTNSNNAWGNSNSNSAWGNNNNGWGNPSPPPYGNPNQPRPGFYPDLEFEEKERKRKELLAKPIAPLAVGFALSIMSFVMFIFYFVILESFLGSGALLIYPFIMLGFAITGVVLCSVNLRRKKPLGIPGIVFGSIGIYLSITLLFISCIFTLTI